jgi:hypothetical protein
MNFKPTIKRAALPFLVLAAGGMGLTLRVMLYTLGMDVRGLLPRYHVFHVLTLALTACVAVALIFAARRLRGSGRYRANFPKSAGAALGTWAAALWLISAAFTMLRRIKEPLDALLAVLAFAAAACMVITGRCRLQGKRPNFLYHSVICLFFACNMVCQYRSWSGNPQLPDYVFHLFACIFLTLTAYYRAAFDLGMGRRGRFLLCNLMSVYLCFLSLVGAGDLRLYFAGGLWAMSNLCALEPPSRTAPRDTIVIPDLSEGV